MTLCIHPWIMETAMVPPLLEDVFSDFDDGFDGIDRFVLPHRHFLRKRKGKKGRKGHLGKVTDDESKMAISLNVSKFKPEELNVSIDGRTITVEGKQEVKDGSNYTARSFLRRWTLPEDIDVEQIRSSLTESGQLAIELPKVKSAVTARSIPIQKAIDEH